MKLPEVVWLWPRLISSGGFIHLFCYIFFFCQPSHCICSIWIPQHWSLRVVRLTAEQHCPLLAEHEKTFESSLNRAIICMLRPHFVLLQIISDLVTYHYNIGTILIPLHLKQHNRYNYTITTY